MSMAAHTTIAVAVFAWCLASAPSASAATDIQRHESLLQPGGSAVIEPFMLDRVAVHEIASGNRRMSVRATPDGYLQFHTRTAVAQVVVTGETGSKATFKLGTGDRVAVWPARRLEVRPSPLGFSGVVEAADWAFVIRADKTSSDGIAVWCGGTVCRLMSGWRLAMDRRGDDIVFRVVQREWPGKVVGKPQKPQKPAPAAKETSKTPEVTPAAPPLPLVERRWAAWEVRPDPPVSP